MWKQLRLLAEEPSGHPLDKPVPVAGDRVVGR